MDEHFLIREKGSGKGEERRVISMYFITISEMLGTNGEKIAKGIAQSLNYHFYGEEELFKAADEMGFLSDIKELGERGPSFMERFFSEKPKIYLERLQSVIYELAQRGNAVFFGRGSQLMLRSFDCAFHVLIMGSKEKRLQRIMEQKGVDREMAETMIRQSDHEKKGFLRFAFDEDWINPKLYDLILNTDKLSSESAKRMILEAAQSDEIKICGRDSVKLLKNLSVLRRIESSLMEAGLMSPRLFITMENENSVRIYGAVPSLEAKETIEKIVGGIKDIHKNTEGLIVLRGGTEGM